MSGRRLWRGGIVAIIAVAVIVVAGVAWIVGGPGPMDFAGDGKVGLADYRAANPTGVPAQFAQASVVKRGEYLARAADCLVCHTVPGGKEYAGGLGFNLPFGTLYSTNITPDKETGIGNYSDQDFLNAVHRGIRRDGARLYPAMPFASYTYMTDADALAIKAYLFSLAPVRATAPANTLEFPFNQRWGMAFWSALFNPDTRFEPDTARSPQWNRGAYLAEALLHCGECHTPRNLAFALDNAKKFGGAVAAGWRAYNISSDKNTGIGGWSDDELIAYLSTGHAPGRGTAAGPMGEAVDQSLSRLVPEDIHAVVAYLRSVPPTASSDLPATLAPPPRQLPWLERDRRGRHNAVRDAGRRADRQRSRRHQCRPDRDFRNQAPCPGGCDLHACLRRHLLRFRDRIRHQLRHRALRRPGVPDHRAGRGGAEKADGPIVFWPRALHQSSAMRRFRRPLMPPPVARIT